jgi:hypothetical protein
MEGGEVEEDSGSLPLWGGDGGRMSADAVEGG